MEAKRTVFDKTAAISIGLSITLGGIIFAAGMLLSQVQRNTSDIFILDSRIQNNEQGNINVLERVTSIEAKLDLLLKQ